MLFRHCASCPRSAAKAGWRLTQSRYVRSLRWNPRASLSQPVPASRATEIYDSIASIRDPRSGAAGLFARETDDFAGNIAKTGKLRPAQFER